MNIIVKDIESVKYMFDTYKWITRGTKYKVIAINDDSYHADHIAINDDFGDRLVLFYDEYEVVE